MTTFRAVTIPEPDRNSLELLLRSLTVLSGQVHTGGATHLAVLDTIRVTALAVAKVSADMIALDQTTRRRDWALDATTTERVQ